MSEPTTSLPHDCCHQGSRGRVCLVIMILSRDVDHIPPLLNTPRWLPVLLRVKVSPYADSQGPILLVTFPPPPFPLTGSVSVPLASCYCIKHTRHSSVSGTALLVPSARSALPQTVHSLLSPSPPPGLFSKGTVFVRPSLTALSKIIIPSPYCGMPYHLP